MKDETKSTNKSMTRTEYLHELRAIVTISKCLKGNKERVEEIENKLHIRINKLLEKAADYIPNEINT